MGLVVFMQEWMGYGD